MRKIREKQNIRDSLMTSYLENNNNLDFLVERERFLRLLQLLSFICNLKGSKLSRKNQVYYLIDFPVADFMRFIGVKNRNQYQLNKVLNSLQSFQKLDLLLQKFSQISFRSSVIFPYLEIEKQGKSWIVTIAVAKELYFYDYPFLFPSCFLSYQNNYDLQVKCKVIQIISTSSLEKKFCVQDFLNQLSVSNQKQTQVKQIIIKLFDELKNVKLIEPQFKIIDKNGSSTKTTKLTPLLITKSKEIYFYEAVNYKG